MLFCNNIKMLAVWIIAIQTMILTSGFNHRPQLLFPFNSITSYPPKFLERDSTSTHYSVQSRSWLHLERFTGISPIVNRRACRPIKTSVIRLTNSNVIGLRDDSYNCTHIENPVKVKRNASPFLMSIMAAMVGWMTAAVVFLTKSIIFGLNRGILAKLPYVLPIIAGTVMTCLIWLEPNIRKALILPLGSDDDPTKYPLMLRQLTLRWIGAIISMGGGAALGTAGMSAEIGMLLTYGLIFFMRRMYNFTSLNMKMLLLAASAAGAAANFNAPLTGVLYALEVTSKLISLPKTTDLEKNVESNFKFQLLLLAVAASFSALYIRSGYFSAPFKPSLDWGTGMGSSYNVFHTLSLYAVVGALSGLLFKIFARIRSAFGILYGNVGDYSGPTIAGIITAATGCPHSIPVGFVIANKIVGKAITVREALKFFMVKFFAVSAAGMSGFMGGQIAPLVFVGSAFGALFYQFLSTFSPNLIEGHGINAFGIMCGAALVGCNFNSIFFPTILIAEMTRSMEPILGVLLTTSVAALVMRL